MPLRSIDRPIISGLSGVSFAMIDENTKSQVSVTVSHEVLDDRGSFEVIRNELEQLASDKYDREDTLQGDGGNLRVRVTTADFL